MSRARLEQLKKQVAMAEPFKPKPPIQSQPSQPAKPTVSAVVTPSQPGCGGVAVQVGKEKRCLKAGEVFRDCAGCPEMVVVPAGDFVMGSPDDEEGREKKEGPQHKVSIAKPFAVSKFETTFAEWDACLSSGGCNYRPDDWGWGRGRRPVMMVSWDNIIMQYLPWLNRKASKPYRLLTEAEWEYAARAGTTTPFSTGMMIVPEQARLFGDMRRGKTIDVGSFKPNAFNLYDMHGNVAEWVQDCYQDNYAGAPVDGSAVTSGDCGNRVYRGGSWGSVAAEARAAYRNGGWFPKDMRSHQLGFRVARTLEP